MKLKLLRSSIARATRHWPNGFVDAIQLATVIDAQSYHYFVMVFSRRARFGSGEEACIILKNVFNEFLAVDTRLLCLFQKLF